MRLSSSCKEKFSKNWILLVASDITAQRIKEKRSQWNVALQKMYIEWKCAMEISSLQNIILIQNMEFK